MLKKPLTKSGEMDRSSKLLINYHQPYGIFLNFTITPRKAVYFYLTTFIQVALISMLDSNKGVFYRLLSFMFTLMSWYSIALMQILEPYLRIIMSVLSSTQMTSYFWAHVMHMWCDATPKAPSYLWTLRFILVIDKNLDLNKNSISKFGNVQKAIFATSYLGLYQNSISPHLQAFIYKTYSLSQFTYGPETTVLNKKTRDYLNICQNNLIRQIIGLKGRCHMTEILKSLKLYNFEDNYVASKPSFLNSIKQNEICSYIFSKLILEKRKKLSKSFIQGINLLEIDLTWTLRTIVLNVIP